MEERIALSHETDGGIEGLVVFWDENGICKSYIGITNYSNVKVTIRLIPKLHGLFDVILTSNTCLQVYEWKNCCSSII